MLRGASALGAAMLVAASPCHAQPPVDRPAGVSRPIPPGQSCLEATAWKECSPHGITPPAKATASAWSVAASALLPGLGQAALGTNRAVPYLAVEAFAWAGYVAHSADSRRQRDAYRGLAASVARAMFSTARPAGDFEYYERMTHYAEAGRYDLVAGGGLDPETDTTTYNGAVWLLARRTYWPEPSTTPDTASDAWKQAIAFYQHRAYDQTYRWSWTGAPAAYAQFRDLIERSNEATRKSRLALGVVIANHLLSTVDAYIVVRLRRNPDARGGGYSLAGTIPIARLLR